MAKKEKVIIFEGEDKFVKPRHHSYDINTGESEFVGGDGAGPGRDPSSNIASPGTTNEREQTVSTNIDNGGGRSGYIVGMPTIGEPNYCNKLRTFIEGRGGGYATPDQIMAAHDMFQRSCMEADPTTTSTTTSTTTITTTLAPSTNTTSPATPSGGSPSTSTSNIIVPGVPVIPILPATNLGIRPVGGGGGGGGDEQAPLEKKKSYWWLLLVALGIYLVAKNKKD